MFAFLNGTIERIQPTHVELDVHGVGYHVFVPETVHRKLHLGDKVKLLTHCYIREDAFSIYGFIQEDERALFTTLLTISGVGPKVALAVLSAMSVQEFAKAVTDNDVSALTRISGIGKKGAQRIILEMKTKLGQDTELGALLNEPSPSTDERDDVVEALLALGCTSSEAKQAATAARNQLGDHARDEDLIRAALRSLAKV